MKSTKCRTKKIILPKNGVCLKILFSSYSAVKIVKSNPGTSSEDTLALKIALVRTEEVDVLTERRKENVEQNRRQQRECEQGKAKEEEGRQYEDDIIHI